MLKLGGCLLQTQGYLLCNLEANRRQHFFRGENKRQGVSIDVFTKFGLKLLFF